MPVHRRGEEDVLFNQKKTWYRFALGLFNVDVPDAETFLSAESVCTLQSCRFCGGVVSWAEFSEGLFRHARGVHRAGALLMRRVPVIDTVQKRNVQH